MSIEQGQDVEAAATAVGPTLREAALSLTGFDEIAIEQAFKREVTELSEPRVARAMVFVMLRREGLDDKAAYGQVMRMPFSEVKGRFRTSDDQGDGEDGDDQQGEG